MCDCVGLGRLLLFATEHLLKLRVVEVMLRFFERLRGQLGGHSGVVMTRASSIYYAEALLSKCGRQLRVGEVDL